MHILILTNFDSFNPGYSLTGCVQDQIEVMLRCGCDNGLSNIRVDVAVSERWGAFGYPLVSRHSVSVHPVIPAVENSENYTSVNELTDEHSALVDKIVVAVDQLICSLSPDVIITHDWIFGGYHLPYAEAIKRICDRDDECGQRARSIHWLHWVHSVCVGKLDWWDLGRYQGDHRIVYPNACDREKVEKVWHISDPSRLVHIPHIKDLRTFCEWGAESWQFVDQYPGIIHADFVQIYPASTDRLTQKGLMTLIYLFANFKRRGHSVCLAIANQWVTRLRRSEDVSKWKRIGERNGLTEKELIFTSEYEYPRYESGLPRRMLREIMVCNSIFVYPTQAESFGLVYPEASLVSGCLCVLNNSVNVLHEVSRDSSFYCDFGPRRVGGSGLTERERYTQWTDEILEEWKSNKAVQDKINMRQKYNMDTVWKDFCRPVLYSLQKERREYVVK